MLINDMSVCRTCRESKPLNEFYSGSKKRCKSCSFEAIAKWGNKNAEKHKFQIMKWREENRNHYNSLESVARRKREHILFEKRTIDPKFNVPVSKTCSKCKEHKQSSEFYYVIRTRTGLSPWCRKCTSEKQAERRKSLGYEDKEKLQRVRRKPLVKGQRLLNGARRRAFIKGIEFELDIDWINARLDTCAISGLPFENAIDSFRPMSASIDRIDSSKGYTKENSRVICFALNAAFNQWGSEAFEPIAKAWLERLANAGRQT